MPEAFPDGGFVAPLEGQTGPDAVAAEVSGGGWRALRRLLDQGVLGHRGDRLEMHALRALALARRAGDDRAFALAMAWLCTLQPAVRVDERLACARAAFELAGDRVGLALMLGERAHRLAFCGRHDEAGPLLRETQEIFHALGDTPRLAKTHQTLAVAPLLRGDLDAARRHVAIVREAFEAVLGGLRAGPA